MAENARQECAHARPLPIERPGMWADLLRVFAGFFGAIRGLALWTPVARQVQARSSGPEDRRTARRVHTSRKRVIGLRPSREKVLDRIVARSVPGRFGLAQVESSDPPRRSCRRIVGADGLIDGGVRSIRLTGGVY